MSNVSWDSLLDAWNQELSWTLLPTSVFLILCIVVGVVGNSLVIAIYGLKIRGAKERYFIPYLALVDLLAVCETAGFNVYYNFRAVNYNNKELCRWSWFFGYLTVIMSTFILLVIAIQRYLKICKPFAKQMTLKWKRVAILCAFVGAVVIAAPITVTYGLDPVYSERRNVTGSACRRLTQENRSFSLVHAIICNVVFAGVVWALIILYTLIGRTIYAQMEQWKTQESSGNTIQLDNMPDGTNNSSISKRNKKTMFKTTLMFMLISVIFIISFSPKVVIFILECLNDRFWDSLPPNTGLLVRFFEVTFVINNIANPFVYAFLDVKFSQQLRRICCGRDISA
uniref:Cholecystokinin receptor type A-like n=1 Tax=Crassostrea virginica TaxID=6565 RepID=A0A8B8CLV1_CRAVI|nr:cholecystokinin receptor type A-like [Crassostrea virginica]